MSKKKMDVKEAIEIALEFLDLAHGHPDDDNEDMDPDLKAAMLTLEAFLAK